MLLTLLSILVYLTSFVLIVLVSMQTTKSEGFSGMIGGGTQTSSKYLPGSEEILQRWTTITAVSWMVSCFFWFLVSSGVH